MRVFAALAKAKHATGKDGRDLAAALVRGHRGRISGVGDGFFHCGLLADAPTTACP
jgi:hypothetical protein